nr:hypothetical protein [uncultured Gammaproteobacteria bacterium]
MPNLVLGAGGAAADAYTIDQSLRFDDGDSAYLSRTQTAGNRKTWTWSGWAKRCQLAATLDIFGTPSEGDGLRWFGAASNLNFLCLGSGGAWIITDAEYRDVGAWYHIVLAFDTTESVAADRVKLWVNGVQVTSFSSSSYPAEDSEFKINNSGDVFSIGRGHANDYLDGYLAEVYFIDGTAYDADDFGETDTTTNQWKPIDAVDDLTFGTNGFYQKYSGTELADSFTDDSTAGDDSPHTITGYGDVTNTLAQAKVGASSIYFDGTGDYLSIPSSSDFGFGTGEFTFETWVRFAAINEYQWIIGSNADNHFDIMYSTDGTSIYVYLEDNGDALTFSWSPSTDTWYHLAVVRQSDTLRVYIDGTQLGTGSAASADINATGLVFGMQQGSTYPLNGYLDSVRLSDSVRYPDGTTFTPSTTEFTADSNTMLLISIWTGGLGADSSGNYNTFTPTNLVAGDQVLDSPTNNWATCRLMNYPPSSGATFTEGNLYLTTGSSGGGRNTGRMSVSTILANSGKWYAELMVFSTTSFYCGVGTNQVHVSSTSDNTRYAFIYGVDGKVLLNTDGSEAFSTYGSAFSTGDIVQIYIDMDASTPEVYFGKNGSWGDGSGNFDETTPTSAVVLGDTFFTADTDNAGFFEFQFSSSSGGTSAQGQFNFGQDSTFSSQTAAGGYSDTNEIGDFKYTVPSGAKALCVSNLPDPEIKLPGDNFNTVIWTGDASATRSITGLGFQADMMWSKNRSGSHQHNVVDTVRGVDNRLIMPNSSDAEDTSSAQGYFQSLDSDGWTMVYGSSTGWNVNKSGYDYVGWAWKGGGSAVTNTDGTNIDSQVSANTTAGFSICTYTGTGTNADSFGHGLSSAELVIIKRREPSSWQVGSTPVGWTKYLVLDTAAAAATSSVRWNDTAPSASVVTLGTSTTVNASGGTYVAYCFHSVEGYSKVGRYEGNGNADGTFVYTGFRPAFIMTKSVDSTSDWQMFDDKRVGYNVDNYELEANDNVAEDTSTDFIDIVSNGFKNRITTDPNVAETYIYIAFASYPFKYSPAR